MRAHKPGVAIVPTIQNITQGKWDGPGLARLLADPARREKLANDIVKVLAANKLQGVTIDFENVTKGTHPDLEVFLTRLSQLFAPHGWIIVQAAPFDDGDWPYRAYSQIVDYTMLMAYDEADDSSPAGAIAGQGWYEKILDKRMRQLPADSTIVALGSYAYDWVNGGRANVLGFRDAMGAARDAGATVQFDPATSNPHFGYREGDGTAHNVWFLDAVTVFNQIHAADQYRPAGYALWRLGSEDPTVVPLDGAALRSAGARQPEIHRRRSGGRRSGRHRRRDPQGRSQSAAGRSHLAGRKIHRRHRRRALQQPAHGICDPSRRPGPPRSWR